MVAERAGELGLQGACQFLLGAQLPFGRPSSHNCRGDKTVCSPTTPTMLSWEWEAQESGSYWLSPTRLVASAALRLKCVPTDVLASKPKQHKKSRNSLSRPGWPRSEIGLPLLPNSKAARRDYCASPWAELEYICISSKPRLHRDTPPPTRPHVLIVPHPVPRLIQSPDQ